MLTLAVIDPISIVLAVVGGSGVLGGVVAFLKLKPDVNTSMVTQAQSAAETIAVVQKELLADRDAWHKRAVDCEAENERLEKALEEYEHRREHDAAGGGPSLAG